MYTVKYHSKMTANENDFRTTKTEGLPFQQNSTKKKKTLKRYFQEEGKWSQQEILNLCKKRIYVGKYKWQWLCKTRKWYIIDLKYIKIII